MKVNAGPAESNGRLLLGIWRDSLHVTCGLTACTPGSNPGPTLGNEYGKTLPFLPAAETAEPINASYEKLDRRLCCPAKLTTHATVDSQFITLIVHT